MTSAIGRSNSERAPAFKVVKKVEAVNNYTKVGHTPKKTSISSQHAFDKIEDGAAESGRR